MMTLGLMLIIGKLETNPHISLSLGQCHGSELLFVNDAMVAQMKKIVHKFKSMNSTFETQDEVELHPL
jgi:hypothetical protein